MRYVFECVKCGEQSNPTNILDPKHLWKAFKYDGKVWTDENGNPIIDYIFEIKKSL